MECGWTSRERSGLGREIWGGVRMTLFGESKERGKGQGLWSKFGGTQHEHLPYPIGRCDMIREHYKPRVVPQWSTLVLHHPYGAHQSPGRPCKNLDSDSGGVG